MDNGGDVGSESRRQSMFDIPLDERVIHVQRHICEFLEGNRVRFAAEATCSMGEENTMRNTRVSAQTRHGHTGHSGPADQTSQDGTEEYDIVVLATGYTLSFPFLSDSDPTHQNNEIKLPNVHNIYNKDDLTLSYIGFVRPNVGAIPPMSELQVYYWLHHLEQRQMDRQPAISDNNDSPTYWLLGDNARTGAYAVDYGAYMHDLARGMGCDPKLSQLIWKSPRTCVAWAMGQAYVSFFRLRGPFFSEDMYEICEKELLAPVLARPVLSNLVFIAVFIPFLLLNCILYPLQHVLKWCRIYY